MTASGAPLRIRGADNLRARLEALSASGNRRGMLSMLAHTAEDEAKNLVPKKTGNLYRSIRVGTITDKKAEVKAGGTREVGYAAHVEFGTKGGQMLRPVKKRALAWGGPRRLSGTLRTGGKAEFFSMGHLRGATRAQPYLVPGAKKAIERGGLKDAVIKTWNEAA